MSDNTDGWEIDDETVEAFDTLGELLRPVVKELISEEEWESIPDDAPLKCGGDDAGDTE